MIVFSAFAIKFSAVYVVLIGGGLGLVLTAINCCKNIKNSQEKPAKIIENGEQSTEKTVGENAENGGERV